MNWLEYGMHRVVFSYDVINGSREVCGVQSNALAHFRCIYQGPKLWTASETQRS